MTTFEILLVIIGLILFGGSFFASEKITATKEQLKAAIDENEVKKLIQTQINNMNEDITQIILENLENSTGEVKRSMEKLSNEKIMAIDEYSDTVMEAIQKNHNEVMFLYGMLNDKNKEIKETADLITKANKGMNKKISEATTLVNKLDSQIAFINQSNSKQTASLERIEKSTKAIEGLDKQLDKIEHTASQNLGDIDQSKGDSTVVKNNIKYDKESKQIESQTDHLDSKREGNETKNASYYNQTILEQSKNGQSALEIAKALGLGVGEVQLVIDLFEGGKR